MGKALQEGDCLSRGMARPQSFLRKKGDRRSHCLLINTSLEPRKLDFSSDFARDSPLDLNSLVFHTSCLGVRCGGTFQVLKFLTFFVAMQYLLTLTLVFLAILNRQDRNLAGSIVHSIPITRQYYKEPEKDSMSHKEKHS